MTTQGIADQEWRPNLFIAGFHKCGTTEFCDYLSQHPDIFLSSYVKEPNTFYDLAKSPSLVTGDRTGNTRLWSISLNDYYELFSKGKEYKYRVDGSVSYTFDPKFSHILKSFSENAKVILLIRNQKRRLPSTYFYSFVRHKENDFARWLHDYFIPNIRTYLYYDKVAAYYHEFGDNNLRIIETNNLSSEDVHKQLFEYLEVEPIKISIKHKNATLLGPEDSKIYRQLILMLTSIRLGTLRVGQKIGLEKQASMTTWGMADLAHLIFKKHNKKNNNYSDIIRLIPEDISSILDEDYKKTLNFANQKRIMICPAC
jgi:Sulfotransferase domain